MRLAGIRGVPPFRFFFVNTDSRRRERSILHRRHDPFSRPADPQTKSSPKSRPAALLVTVAAAFLLGGCQVPSFGAYRGATTQGHATFKLWQGSMIAALAVGALVLGLILWAVLRYRKRDDAMPKQTQYHLPLEIAYTVIPLIIVAFLFYFTVVTENQVDALPPQPAVKVKVTAFQWGWRFHYLGHHVVVEGNDVTGDVPEMVLPVGQTVRIILVSNDVVHGFYVAAFDFSRYALPGVTNRFDLNVRHAGVYPGRCTQFCGLYHTQMLFTVKAVPAPQFQTWLASKAPSRAQPASTGAQHAGAGTSRTSNQPGAHAPGATQLQLRRPVHQQGAGALRAATVREAA